MADLEDFLNDFRVFKPAWNHPGAQRICRKSLFKMDFALPLHPQRKSSFF